jgi:pimeloyl-ACP methyl ester carboxylesterase/DNA-binding SARP family transcriptional activator
MATGPGTPTGNDALPVRFAQAKGARIAYQEFGDGPAVVSIPPTAQNVEAAWEWPDIRSMLDELSSFCRWVHFDKRGTGASDRRTQMPGIDERVHDLEAVMDAAGLDRAFLYGCSEGGPMSLLFAATYPDRVNGIILHGSAAYTSPPGLDEEAMAELRLRFDAYCALYGTEESPVAAGFAPSLADNEEFLAWHRRYERVTTDRVSLREMLEISAGIDVRDILPSVGVPVLLLHCIDDPVIPIEWARETASLLPDATLIELEGADHFQYAGDRSWVDDVQRFVTGEVTERTMSTEAIPSVVVRTLGRFAVEVDGVEVPTSAWGSRRARQLCKYLVAAQGWPITRDVLFDRLWPDETNPRKLGPRLSVQLSAVRRVLGGGVVADRDTIALDLAEVHTDLAELLDEDDDQRITELYVGEFLPQDAYEDWSASVRDTARRRFVDAAHRLGAAAMDGGDGHGAAVLAHRLIDVDEFDDAAHLLLVRALLQPGHEGEARRAHGRWSTAMAELNITPPPFSTDL